MSARENRAAYAPADEAIAGSLLAAADRAAIHVDRNMIGAVVGSQLPSAAAGRWNFAPQFALLQSVLLSFVAVGRRRPASCVA
jgi:hypothetical protein